MLSGTLSYILHARSLAERVDAGLARDVRELRALALEIDPATGTQYATSYDLLHTALERHIPDRNAGFLVLIDRRVTLVPGAPGRLQLEQVTTLRTEVASLEKHHPARFGTVTHGERRIRYVAVPVAVAGDPSTGIFIAAVDLTSERTDLLATARAQMLAGLLTLVLLVVIGTVVFRRLLRPLRQLAQTAEHITDEDMGRRIPEEGADDLARLTRTVNSMLDRLEGAFATQRALLDDVGHELRTPLTVLRGHLETMDAADARDVSDTRALLLDEIDRMGRLVDELVLLAKAERPDFLVSAPVDLDSVVAGALERGRGLAERRFGIDEEAHTEVVLDRQRITQALLQLLSNAIRYTDTDDEIGLGARCCGDQVQIWVRDTGTGISVADHARIFDRFERGGTRANESQGSGLGLSIVRAIARAHGGDVGLTSAPGQGATFTLTIPVDCSRHRPQEEP